MFSMKKLISVFLCAVLLLTAAVPALAAVDPVRTGSNIPIVFLAGDGEAIYNENDEVILKISENGLLGLFQGGITWCEGQCRRGADGVTFASRHLFRSTEVNEQGGEISLSQRNPKCIDL